MDLSEPVKFGKYRGKKMEILLQDKGYLSYLQRSMDGGDWLKRMHPALHAHLLQAEPTCR